jgi:hypothetical protein
MDRPNDLSAPPTAASSDRIEFLTEEGTVLNTEDDVIEFGRSQLPRWAIFIGCAAAAVGFFALAALKSPHHDAVSAETSVPSSAPGGQLGPALDLGEGATILDVLVSGDRLYILQPDKLQVVQGPRDRVIDSIGLVDEDVVPDGVGAQLVIDKPNARLWIVVQGVAPARLLEFDAATLRPGRRVMSPAAISAVTSMDGHLYLAGEAGMADLAHDATEPVPVPAVRGALSSVEADPARHRLLVLGASSSGTVSAVGDGRVTAQHDFGQLSKGRIAVVADQIWVGGYGPYGARLARLQPDTLAPVQISPVAAKIVGAVVTEGVNIVWVSTGGLGLWCIDPVSGLSLAVWPSGSSPVASRTGAAYVVDSETVRRLVLPKECAG